MVIMEDRNIRPICSLFAEILDYPKQDLLSRVEECAGLLSSVSNEAQAQLDRFRAFVEETSPGRMEEIYTSTFDLQMVCYPYAGYHLFGESYKRGIFMARLKEDYRARGFAIQGNELPDHLSVLLRFLAFLEEDELSRSLLDDCLIPVLSQMEQVFSDNDNPYGEVIRSLSALLRRQP
jgi:nitrate reductase delta subunit